MSLNDGGHYGNSTIALSNDQEVANTLDKLLSTVLRHRLLFYILLNTCCAAITFFGKILVDGLFGALTTQEENLLRKSFRRFIQTKITFFIFISHHNLFEDILIWMPWLAIYITCAHLLELSSSRMSNPFNIVSNKLVRRRLYTANIITNLVSLLMATFFFSMRNYINLNYTLFLLADCTLLFAQSLHFMFKLFTIIDSNTQNGQATANSSYYVDLAYDLVHDSIEFINYLHMIFYSQLAVTFCCLFLIIQAKQYYTRISTKIQKHWQHQEISRHINSSYAKATDDDLMKNSLCTICWQTMKSARKLPCGHVFHDLCLRRWLEQDSSCAICRQSLSLNVSHVARNGNELMGEDVDSTLQYVVEAFSPHNNRLARWWTRLLFDSLNNEQVNAMVDRVAEMFPHVPRDRLHEVVRDAGSVTGAVDILLARAWRTPNDEDANDAAADNAAASSNDPSPDDDSDSSDEVPALSDVSLDNLSDTDEADENSSADLFNAGATHDDSTDKFIISLASSNTWFGSKAKEMISANRSKYLQSTRAQDLRQESLTSPWL